MPLGIPFLQPFDEKLTVAFEEHRLGKELLDIAVAEHEAKTEPDGVADHVRLEPMSGIGDGRQSQPYRRCQQPSAFP